jgi:predicted metal-dependent hydrolase
MHDAVRWGRTEIAYSYSFSVRSSLSISVHPDLTVTVKAPPGTTLRKIRDLVRKRAAWIRKAWREFELYLPKQPPRRYISGETHRYLGRQYRLKVERDRIEKVTCARGYLWVTAAVVPTTDRVRTLLDGWYLRHAERIFAERFDACCQRAAMEGIATPMFRIVKMRTRWGTCSRAGRVNLNVELVKAPKECIDYVITHELCHIKERHHGPRFWRLLGKLIPDFGERRKKLNMLADV